LKPRSTDAPVNPSSSGDYSNKAAKPNPFGDAKPIDQSAIIKKKEEERKQREEQDKKRREENKEEGNEEKGRTTQRGSISTKRERISRKK